MRYRSRRRFSFRKLKSYIRKRGRHMSRAIRRINHLSRGGIRI